MEWLDARARIHDAQTRQQDPQSPSRILIVVHSDPADEDRIAALIASYKTRFAQQSVLRLDVKSIARF